MIFYITVDTEYDFGFTRRNGLTSRRDNLWRSIYGVVPSGEAGIRYQMTLLDRYGLKAVFFVDPMPAMIWGTAAIEDIVGPIVERGHDVQLHMHTEWLELAGSSSVTHGTSGPNIKDFRFDEQCALLDYAKGVLVSAGAPQPIAFRAGNYGASDDTLRALAAVGLHYDTSYCPGIPHSPCTITLTSANLEPVEHYGVTEVPVGCIGGWRDSLRHAQLTAMSSAEMRAAIRWGSECARESFTLVTHSFELLSRDRTRINNFVRPRFEALCRALAGTAGVRTGTYAGDPPRASGTGSASLTCPLPFNPFRAGMRVAEQGISNALYGRR